MIGGDQRARFSALVTPHLSDALTMALWLTGNRADAEDVIQETCLRAFRAIDDYSGGGARAWVLTITRNTAYSWLRKNRRPDLVALDEVGAEESVERGLELLSTDHASPEAELIAKTETERFRAAIAKLAPEFRETLVLRDIQGLEYREIAQITGTPVGTVMSRLARGRRHLIRSLSEKLDGPK